MVARTSAPTRGITERKRVSALDGARFFCALAVILCHAGFTTGTLGAGNQPLGFAPGAILINGLRGVAIGPFFLLSALFLYRPFARRTLAGAPKPDLARFFVRRFLRLMPAYWVLVAFCLLFINFDRSILHGAWDWIRPFVLMNSYNFHWYAGLDPTWTVPTEMQFYLVLPLVAGLMHWFGRKGTDPRKKAARMMIPLSVFVAFGVAWTAYVHLPSKGPFPTEYWWAFWSVGLFATGMALAIVSVLAEISPNNKPALHRWALRRPNLFWLGALAIFAINAAEFLGGRPGYTDWETIPGGILQYWLIIAFSFFLVVPLAVPGASSRLMNVTFGNRPMQYLGRISYGIYLWHFAVMYLILRSGSIFGGPPLLAPFLRGKMGFWVLIPGVTAGSIAIATVSYFLLERPLIQMGERWAARRQERRAAAAAARTPLVVAEAPAAEVVEKVERVPVGD
jgi:peptidoglycan/LPS O-acetylase OafA/YrhL